MIDRFYQDLLGLALKGRPSAPRGIPVRCAGIGHAVFEHTPIVSVRRTAWRTALREWEWFVGGSWELEHAHPAVREWWAPHAVDGELPPYFDVCDWQLFVDRVVADPGSRRNVFNALPGSRSEPPACTWTSCQALVQGGDRLSFLVHQRSCDLVCGAPHDMMQYWAVLLWLSAQAKLKPGVLHWTVGDAHVYEAHVPLARRIVFMETPQTDLRLEWTGGEGPFRADGFKLVGPYQPLMEDRACPVTG